MFHQTHRAHHLSYGATGAELPRTLAGEADVIFSNVVLNRRSIPPY
jgi:hypothetical protein